MADSQIYAKQLLVKRHGYPLWIPEPYGHSPIYRTKGVRIGDVGYVTQDGGFETLFNIRASPNDPINRRGVPNGFQQIRLGADDIVNLPNFHNLNSAVTSISAKQRSLGAGLSVTQAQTLVGAGAALEYVWSSTEGAILHLPKGASRITAMKSVFKEQATRHAKNWYEFALANSDVSNGSLYVVTGCDKTNSWMVGAFSDCASGSQATLQLSVAGLLEGQLSYDYSWATSSPAIQRVGPSIDQTIASDEDPDALEMDDQIFATDAPQKSNQCAFIRGYKIALRRDVLRRILGGPRTTIQISSIEDATEEDIQRKPYTIITSSAAWYSKGNAKTSGDGRDSGGEWDEEPGDDFLSDNDDVVLEEIPGPCEDCHPSTLINNFMLEKYSDAEVAIAHDDDWIDLIDDEDQLWPTDDELLSRLQLRRTFYHSQNIVLPVADIRPDSSSERQFIVVDKFRDVLQIDGTLTRGTDDGERSRKRAYRTPECVPQFLPSPPPSLVGTSTYNFVYLTNSPPRSDSLAEQVSFPIIEPGREPHVTHIPIANRQPTTSPKRGPLPRSCNFCRTRRIKCEFRGDAGSCEHCLRLRLKCVPWAPKVTSLTPHSMLSSTKTNGPLHRRVASRHDPPRSRQQRALDQSSPQPER